MRLLKSLLLASTLIANSAHSAQAGVNVVASIKPIHSLVAAVMDGVGTPGLIVEGAGSPHTYALKPSQARELQNADIVFWIGHDLEGFLEKPLEAIATKAKAVELIDAHNLVRLEFRKGGAFDKHDHGSEEEHSDHDDHGKKAEKDHDHDHEKKVEKDHDHDHEAEKTAQSHEGHDEHKHGSFDPHVWLDPMNAKTLVQEIEEALVAADPENAAKYKANAQAVTTKLDALVNDVSAELQPVKDRGFVVFHDAYQYFEKRFGIAAAGSITISPEVIPGAERVKEIRAKVQELGASCVFSEPQFEPKLIATVVEGTKAKSGVIDPLGAKLDNGPDLYFDLIRGMAKSIKNCLTEAS